MTFRRGQIVEIDEEAARPFLLERRLLSEVGARYRVVSHPSPWAYVIVTTEAAWQDAKYPSWRACIHPEVLREVKP